MCGGGSHQGAVSVSLHVGNGNLFASGRHRVGNYRQRPGTTTNATGDKPTNQRFNQRVEEELCVVGNAAKPHTVTPVAGGGGSGRPRPTKGTVSPGEPGGTQHRPVGNGGEPPRETRRV